MKSPWGAVEYHLDAPASGEHALQLLRDHKAAVIVVKGLIQPAEYLPVVAEIARRRDEATVSRYANGALTTFGPYLARHLAAPAAYFEAARAGGDLFAGQPADLRAVVRSRLASFLRVPGLDVAREADGREYAPAIVRVHADGVSNPLHNDNIMRDAASSGLMLAHLRHQFSCVTCLQECDGGGELLHYRRRWRPDDERSKVPNGLGYTRDVVREADVCRFRPQTGDVYIIDPTNYHAIEAVRGRDRITMGFFFGFFDDHWRRAVCWS